jgi:hypothetical protein
MKLTALLFLLPTICFSQGLDLGLEQAGKVVSPESLFPYAKITLVLFSFYLVCGISLLAFFFIKKKKTWVPPTFLENFPVSAKAAITLGLVSYSFVHILALTEVFLVTKISFKSTSEYFFYMKLPKLLATSHAHFFGHGTMYMATGLIFIFSKISETWKIIFISIALSAGLLDVPSWWAIKYGGAEYELFSGLAGIMSVIGWGFMAVRIFYELWWSEIFGRKI